MAEMKFYNRTDGGKWSGKGGQTITVQVSDGLLPTQSHDVRSNDHWIYNAKFSKVKVKFKSRTYIRGFESYTMTHHSCNDMSREINIVESNHKMTFNTSIEWPPRFPDKL